MPKPKKDETVEFLEDLLLMDTSELNEEEAEATLRDTGIDVVEFDRNLANMVRDIATRERQEGRSVPGYLKKMIRQLDPEGPLPSGLEEAKRKAGQWVAGLADKLTPPEAPTVLASYRKGDDALTDSDQDLLERERKVLLERTKHDDQTG